MTSLQILRFGGGGRSTVEDHSGIIPGSDAVFHLTPKHTRGVRLAATTGCAQQAAADVVAHLVDVFIQSKSLVFHCCPEREKTF